MRDRLMNEEYFKAFIAEEEARGAAFSAKLSAGTVQPDRVFSVEQRIHSLRFSAWIGKYSLGEDLEKLREEFWAILAGCPHYWTKTTSYVNLVWVLAIAVMLEAEPERVVPLAGRIEEWGRQDALLDFFSGFLLHGTTTLENSVFTCPKPYGELEKIIREEEGRVERLKKYLEKKWYPGHRQFGICDVHKAKEKLYSGYWSFESGAVAKILKLEDSPLKGLAYYPYDLVHFND